MSINNGDVEDEVLAPPYEEFEDILAFESNRAASTDALLPESPVRVKSAITEDTLRHDIEKVEKLRPEEVRWFYKSGKKKKWKAFIGSDSIAIESEWRCISKSDNDIQRVCVRGGMYEVDVLERKCYPVYWSSFNLKGVEDSVEITRGTWFYDGSFVPLEENFGDRIEAEHVERWKGCSLEEVKYLIGNTVMHSMKLPHCHVDWYSVNDVYVHSDAVSYRALRNIVQRFGASKTSTSGHRLHRGYREDAICEDCMPQVKHLVFVVHGIGAKPDRHKIVRNTNEFRVACDRVAAKHFTHYTERVEFLPVEWRSKLLLDDGLVETLTPKKGQGVRQFLNNNLMDIMYYTSPLYRGEIVQALKKEITRLHRMFMERNPEFDGKISVFAHSLGSVIMHDIMTCWTPESLFEEYLKKQYAENGRTMEHSGLRTNSTDTYENEMRQIAIEKAKVAQLEVRALSKKRHEGLGFIIENFFCAGSPLAIFLYLRGQRPSDGSGTQDDIIPRSVCRRIFNIFHPADPIAYRFEPLVLSHYVSIAPLQVHWHNALHKTPYNEMTPKPYQAELAKEMVSISPKEVSVDSEIASVDISDADDASLKEDMDVGSIGLEQSTEAVSSDDNPGVSPPLDKRSSYLKAISGGAFRVGKALWSKARGSSPTNARDGASLDSSLVIEQELGEIHSDEMMHEREGSIGSSDSCSPGQGQKQQLLVNQPHSSSVKKLKVNEREISFEAVCGSPVQLEQRLDYELQEGFTESRLGYASITSHTSYWGNQDVAFFVLMQIHPEATMTQSLRS